MADRLLQGLARTLTDKRWLVVAILAALTVIAGTQIPRIGADFTPSDLFASFADQERIAEELDPSTRTARALVRVANPDRRLRPGMFATVHLLAPGEGPLVTRLVIPAQAVVVDGAERWAFVEVGPRTFERRAVEVEALGEDELVVLSGLAPGERLVIQGAFTLKSELAEGEFGGHHH